MLLNDAMKAIDRKQGYRVSFEWRDGAVYSSDLCPDRSEKPLPSEDEAWGLARKMASAPSLKDRIVNVYVIHASNFTPVDGYQDRMMNRSRQ